MPAALHSGDAETTVWLGTGEGKGGVVGKHGAENIKSSLFHSGQKGSSHQRPTVPIQVQVEHRHGGGTITRNKLANFDSTAGISGSDTKNCSSNDENENLQLFKAKKRKKKKNKKNIPPPPPKELRGKVPNQGQTKSQAKGSSKQGKNGKNPGVKRSGSSGSASSEQHSLDSDEAEDTESISDKAKRLAGDLEALAAKLVCRTFLNACRRKGVDPQSLMPKDIDDFRAMPQLQGTPEAELQLRATAWERQRRKLLEMVLAHEAFVQKKARDAEIAKQRREEKLSRTLRAHALKETRIRTRMHNNLNKYEQIQARHRAKINNHAEGLQGKEQKILHNNRKVQQKTSRQLARKAEAKRQQIEQARQRKAKIEEAKRREQEERARKVKEKEQRIAEYHQERKTGTVVTEQRAHRAEARERRLKDARHAQGRDGTVSTKNIQHTHSHTHVYKKDDYNTTRNS